VILFKNRTASSQYPNTLSSTLIYYIKLFQIKIKHTGLETTYSFWMAMECNSKMFLSSLLAHPRKWQQDKENPENTKFY